MRHALHAIRAATSRQPHVRVEYRASWVSILLALLLGLALFPLTAYVALPAWREHRDYVEHEFMIAELKKIPSAISESPPPE